MGRVVAVIALAPCGRLSDYEESVRRAGGRPRVIDRAVDRPADVVKEADGILLAGGGDVRPELYGETPHATFSSAEVGRDDYELELVRRALEADLPLFAICRGIQVLTVARGGTLVQDIPSDLHSAVDHMVRDPRDAAAHHVSIASDSLLARLMGTAPTRPRSEHFGEDAAPATQPFRSAGTIPVNSRHHQAPKVPGAGLVITAVAPDGVIEGIEDPSMRYCLGVQWHPENFWRTGEFRALFEGFVRAAAR